MALRWFQRLFRRGRGTEPYVIVLRNREVALRFPTQTPFDASGHSRQDAPTCKKCSRPLVEVLLTTGGPEGDAELWREHPLAVDAWHCEPCGVFELTRFLEPAEVTSLGKEGARHGEAGRLDEAELAFRRICNSWPQFAAGRLNLASVYTQRIREEALSTARSHVIQRYISVVEHHVRDALRGKGLPSLPAAIQLLAGAHLAMDVTAAAEAAVDAGLAHPAATEEDRKALEEVRRWVRLRGDLYERGADAVRPYAHVHGQEPPPVDARTRRQLELGVEDLLKHQQANPSSWQALWLAGKGLQALGDTPRAAEVFGRAFALQPGQPDVAREYGLQLLHLQRFAEAEDVVRAATEAAPSDAGLVANLALVLLLRGRTEEAEATASRALGMDSKDPVTQALLGRIREVRSGRRPAPRSLEELERNTP